MAEKHRRRRSSSFGSKIDGPEHSLNVAPPRVTITNTGRSLPNEFGTLPRVKRHEKINQSPEPVYAYNGLDHHIPVMYSHSSWHSKNSTNITESTTIKVHISLTQYRLGTHQNPCSLQSLGIVPNRYSTSVWSGPFRSFKSKKLSSPVIIRGIVPASPAALTGGIEPGDQITLVNGNSVNMINIDQTLFSLSNEVIFDVMKYPKDIPPDVPFSPPPTFTIAKWTPSPPPSLPFIPPLVLYLTLDTREDDAAEKDILYKYSPTGGESMLNHLTQLRGVILTLSDVTSSLFGSKETCCCLCVEEQLFHVAGKQYGKEVLIVALSVNRVTLSQVKIILQAIEESLIILYGSLHKAFTQDDDSEYLVSSVLSSLFDVSLSSSSYSSYILSSLTSPMSLTRRLQLSFRTSAQLSAKLNILDSAIHKTDSHTTERYIPHGSCLFYKGYLLTSHVTSLLLKMVVVLCFSHKLLEKTSRTTLSQTLIWRRVFDPSVTCIEDIENRRGLFVLVMGMEETLLCQVLEGVCDNESTPPSSWVESVRTVLEDVHWSGLLSQCEGRIMVQLPVLTSADILLASLVSSSSFGTKLTPKRSTGSIRSISTVGGGSQSDSESEMSTSFSASKTKSTSIRSLARLSFRLRKSRSSQSLAEHTSPRAPSSLNRPNYMLTAGIENILLYYVTLDEGRGVVISPCDEHTSNQPVNTQLLVGFKDVVGTIHQILYKKYKEEKDEEEEDEMIRLSSPDVHKDNNPFINEGSSVIEHGILMECSTTSHTSFPVPTLQYWVVGRLFVESNQEVYVCFQENLSQITIEMIYKLLFGTLP